jgi:Ca2+/H+ antiporter, TMEM165/GDT1 family
VQWILTALSATAAAGVELLEALAIVLAVGASRRWRDALLGAGAAVIACLAIAAAVGPALLAQASGDPLRVIVGVLLLLFGLEWLRKGVLRLAGRRARSSSAAEYDETRSELEDDPLPLPGRPDWAGRIVAFKGVLLEGIEVVLIVSALGARPGGLAPALAGTAIALVLVVGLGVWARRPLSRVPETELKCGVGVVLTTFGTFFCAEGLGVDWPGGDLALLYVGAVVAAVAAVQVAALARPAARVKA